MFRKNVSGQFIHLQGVDSSTGGIKSGVTWTVRRCIDGTFAAATGTVTEDGTTGWYKFAMSQADTNGNNIGFNFTGTGAVPQTVNIVTTAADPTDGVRLGLTALPNAAADAAGGLPISDAGGLDLDAQIGTKITSIDGRLPAALTADGNIKADTLRVGGTLQTARDLGASVLLSSGTGAGQISLSSGTVTVGTNNDKTGYGLSSAAVQAIWDALTSALTTAGSIGKLLVDSIDAAISTRATPAQVNTEVLDVLNTDTFAEPGQEAPPATTTLVKKIGYLYKAFRNRITATDSTISLYADNGTTVDQKASHSDDGTTYDRNEFVTGP